MFGGISKDDLGLFAGEEFFDELGQEGAVLEEGEDDGEGEGDKVGGGTAGVVGKSDKRKS